VSSDEFFMARALDVARRAPTHDDVPVGCVVVVDGAVVAEAENCRELNDDPTAHAEILALREAARVRGRWRLDGATVYVTLEPCVMCAGALVAARVDRLVVGALDEKAGAVGSRYHLLADPRLLHEVAVTYDVRAEESAEALRQFFATRRSLKVD
jgi:tRNA(adenine34) deaminase